MMMRRGKVGRREKVKKRIDSAEVRKHEMEKKLRKVGKGRYYGERKQNLAKGKEERKKGMGRGGCC